MTKRSLTVVKKCIDFTNYVPSEGYYAFPWPGKEMIPPLFNDYEEQSIYCPTDMEEDCGLHLGWPPDVPEDAELKWRFDERLHMKKTVECLKGEDEWLQIVGSHPVTGELLIAHFDNINKALSHVDSVNHCGFEMFIYLNSQNRNPAPEWRNVGFYELDEEEEAKLKIESDIKYFRVEVLPVKIEGDQKNCNIERYDAKQEAEVVAWRVLRYLKNELGFTSCFMAATGSGFDLIWKVDFAKMKSVDYKEKIVENCLLALAHMFNTDGARININGSKRDCLVPLYGSLVNDTFGTKYPFVDTNIVHAPVKMRSVPAKNLAELAKKAPEEIRVLNELEDGEGNEYNSVDYQNRKKKLKKFVDDMLRGKLYLRNVLGNSYYVVLKAEDGSEKLFKINSKEFCHHLQNEYYKSTGTKVKARYWSAVIDYIDTNYRLLEDYIKF